MRHWTQTGAGSYVALVAVAPVAVEMGPRSRRRITTGAVTLIATVAVVTLGLWFFGGLPFGDSANHSRSSEPIGRVITLIPQQPNMAYGMTKQQMVQRLGHPVKIDGQCWEYPENVKNFVGGLINAVRLCFWNNQYQHWYMELDGKWRADTYRGARVVIPPPTRP